MNIEQLIKFNIMVINKSGELNAKVMEFHFNKGVSLTEIFDNLDNMGYHFISIV